MTDELYNEIFAEGEARGKRLERKRCADLVRSIKVADGSGTERFVLDLAANAIEREESI